MGRKPGGGGKQRRQVLEGGKSGARAGDATNLPASVEVWGLEVVGSIEGEVCQSGSREGEEADTSRAALGRGRNEERELGHLCLGMFSWSTALWVFEHRHITGQR